MTYNNLSSATNETKGDYLINSKVGNTFRATSLDPTPKSNKNGTINISINSKNGTASVLSNPTHKELPRHDTYYFNESVKL